MVNEQFFPRKNCLAPSASGATRWPALLTHLFPEFVDWWELHLHLPREMWIVGLFQHSACDGFRGLLRRSNVGELEKQHTP